MKTIFKQQKVFISALVVIFTAAASLVLLGGKVGATSFNITGTIRDPSNNSLGGAYVYATNVGSTTPLYGPVTTAGSGAYNLSIAASGTYDIHIDPPSNLGYAPYTDSSVSVTSAQTINHTFSDVTHTLSGTLKDSSNNPLSGITIDFGSGYATTDSSGNYSITVPAGSYHLSLSGSISSDGIQNFTMAQSNTPSISVLNSDVTLNLTIQLATMTITAYNNAGQPISGAGNHPVTSFAKSGVTTLYPGDPGTNISQINSVGFNSNPDTGTITTIVGATYAASGLDSSSYTSSICEAVGASMYDCLRLPLTITGNTSIDLPTSPPATRTFSGTLTDSNGTPLAYQNITLISGNDSSTTANTDADGNFSINAAPKKYYLQVNGSAIDGINTLTLTQSSSSPSIDLTNGDVTQNLQIPTVTLTVYADDGSGNPKYNTTVYANTSSGTTSLYSGDPGETISTDTNVYISGSSNMGTLGTINGASYSATGLNVSSRLGSICDSGSSGYYNCLTTALTVSGNTSANVPF